MAVALIVAAGLGERLGASRPKALVELAGRPLLHWSLEVLAAVEEIERIVVALPAGVEAPVGTVGVLGGAVRSESVLRALEVSGAGDPVLVHDAARPLLSIELVQATLAAIEQKGVDAAIAATPVTDTIKQADGEGVVMQTLDRAGLWAVQTPQVFRRKVLERALDVSEEVLAQATDDAWLIERAGGRVAIVPAPKDNLKVTTALDLDLAELLLARREE
ncbi:MAG TPA: 2-C-methyl-D-erythritol 4-phosphate cytidylyltransferase [Solirubrobacteraceae bacterium]|nr:2-C-methyl-D-erythritol 4-phosphate cytidylyltransferase [Solirubrobacteraceae bacterium]